LKGLEARKAEEAEMKGIAITIVAALATLTAVSPAMAMGGNFFSGPVSGTVTGGGGTGSFSGSMSGSVEGSSNAHWYTGEFTGTSPVPPGDGMQGVSGTATVGGQQGTFDGVLFQKNGVEIFRGTFTPGIGTAASVSASEPLVILVAGLGLVGARLLRRRR
jgi:hypothetical protein